MADLVAWGRCRGFDVHSPAFAVGSETVLGLDEASVLGSGRFTRLADDHRGDCLWGFSPRARERRALDVSLHAVSRLERFSLRPARILSRPLTAFGDRSRWNRTRERALRPRDTKRFASSPAIFPWRHGLDDSHLRRGSVGAPPSGGTRSRSGGQRSPHRPCQLPPVARSPRFGNQALRPRRPLFFGYLARSGRTKEDQRCARPYRGQSRSLPHGRGSSFELPCDRYTRSLWRR